MTLQQIDITQAVEQLDNSIIYQMSLNSHELFHSNLWAWLMEKDRRFISVFFPELSAAEKIRREEDNRDITIWYDDNNAYVIENKFKSIPTEAQLISYEKKLRLENKFAKGILTGICKPAISIGMGALSNWSFLSYEEIANRIDDYVLSAGEPLDTFSVNVIKQYSSMIRNLCSIVQFELEKNKDHVSQLEPPKTEKYNTIRIRDLLIKMHADAFCAELRNDERYDKLQQSLGQDCELIIEAGFSNKSGIVDALIQVKSNNPKQEYDRRIGVQIQGNQFRLFVSLAKAGNNSSAVDLFKKYQEKDWFECYSQPPKTFKGVGTSMNPRRENNNGQFNKYESSNYWFVYQYFDIKGRHHRMTDQDVKEHIWTFLYKAKELL